METNKTRGWVYEEMIHLVVNALNEYYVFPDVAKEMGEYLNLKLTRKDYDTIKSPEAFSEQITNDLQKISSDKHLRLRYMEHEGATDPKISEKEQKEKYILEAKWNDFRGTSVISICEVFTIRSLPARLRCMQ